MPRVERSALHQWMTDLMSRAEDKEALKIYCSLAGKKFSRSSPAQQREKAAQLAGRKISEGAAESRSTRLLNFLNSRAVPVRLVRAALTSHRLAYDGLTRQESAVALVRHWEDPPASCGECARPQARGEGGGSRRAGAVVPPLAPPLAAEPLPSRRERQADSSAASPPRVPTARAAAPLAPPPRPAVSLPPSPQPTPLPPAVPWYWRGAGGWVAYEAAQAAALESAWRQKLAAAQVDALRTVDLLRMKQIRLDDPTRARAVRRGGPAASGAAPPPAASGAAPNPTAASAVSHNPTAESGVPSFPTAASGANPTAASGASSYPTAASGVSPYPTAASGVSSYPTAASGANPTAASGVSSHLTTANGVSPRPTAASGVSSYLTTANGVSPRLTAASGVSSHPTTASGVSPRPTAASGVSSHPTAASGVARRANGVASRSIEAREEASYPTAASGVAPPPTAAPIMVRRIPEFQPPQPPPPELLREALAKRAQRDGEGALPPPLAMATPSTLSEMALPQSLHLSHPEITLRPSSHPEKTLLPSSPACPQSLNPEMPLPPSSHPAMTLPPSLLPEMTLPPSSLPEMTLPPSFHPEMTPSSHPEMTLPPSSHPETTPSSRPEMILPPSYPMPAPSVTQLMTVSPRTLPTATPQSPAEAPAISTVVAAVVSASLSALSDQPQAPSSTPPSPPTDACGHAAEQSRPNGTAGEKGTLRTLSAEDAQSRERRRKKRREEGGRELDATAAAGVIASAERKARKRERKARKREKKALKRAKREGCEEPQALPEVERKGGKGEEASLEMEREGGGEEESPLEVKREPPLKVKQEEGIETEAPLTVKLEGGSEEEVALNVKREGGSEQEEEAQREAKRARKEARSARKAAKAAKAAQRTDEGAAGAGGARVARPSPCGSVKASPRGSAPGFGGSPSLEAWGTLLSSRAPPHPSPLDQPYAAGRQPSSFALPSSALASTSDAPLELGGADGLTLEVLRWHAPSLMGLHEEEADVAPNRLPPTTTTTSLPLPMRFDSFEQYVLRLHELLLLELAASLASDVREALASARSHRGATHSISRQLGPSDIEVRPTSHASSLSSPAADDVVFLTLLDTPRRRAYLALVSKAEPDGTLHLRQHAAAAAAAGCAKGSRASLLAVASLVPQLRIHAALRQLSRTPRAALCACVLPPPPLPPPRPSSPFPSTRPSSSHATWPSAFGAAMLRLPLNSSQRDAVWHCASAASGLRLVQGPPGTGKTHTVIAIIGALLARRPPDPPPSGKLALPKMGATTLPSLTPPEREPIRVLLATPSNCAIDELVARLVAHGILGADGKTRTPRVVRVGPQERMAAPNAKASLSVHLDELVKKRGALAAEGAAKHAEKRKQIERQVLERAEVVASTLIGAGMETLLKVSRRKAAASAAAEPFFDAIIVDEATQACELSMQVLLQHNARLLCLVGDHKQLPPTVISPTAAKLGLGRSLFERLLQCGYDRAMLRVQYRMHPAIARFPALHFYDGELSDGVLAAQRTPPASFPWPRQDFPVALVHVAGYEQNEGELGRTSKFNQAEAEAVQVVLDALSGRGNHGVDAAQVGVVTPYKGQERLLSSTLKGAHGRSSTAEVATIDSFQGREKEVIVLSCVRANAAGKLGFLADTRRMNVALTRAKRGLIVLGHPPTLEQKGTVWSSFCAWAAAQKLVLPLHELRGTCSK